MFINSGCILQYRQSGYGKWLSLKVTPPSGSAITCYLASQPSSVTGDDIWMSTGRSTLAVTDMTTKKWGLSGLLLVAFSISLAMAISSLVSRSLKSIR